MAGRNDVGYKKPPRHTRFRKGRSGNPKGRPKGTKNLKTDLSEELQERILVREGEKEKRISKQRAMIKGLMARAVKGDARAANLILQMVFRLLNVDGAGEETPLTPDERAILDTYTAGILHRDNREGENPSPTKTLSRSGRVRTTRKES